MRVWRREMRRWRREMRMWRREMRVWRREMIPTRGELTRAKIETPQMPVKHLRRLTFVEHGIGYSSCVAAHSASAGRGRTGLLASLPVQVVRGTSDGDMQPVYANRS